MKIEDKRNDKTNTLSFQDLNIGDFFEFIDKKIDDGVCIKLDEYDQDPAYYTFNNNIMDGYLEKENLLVNKVDITLTINRNA